MSFTGPTSEIGIQGALPLSFQCSGTIEKGQGVVVCGDMQVKAAGVARGTDNFASGCIGVAEYYQDDGDWVAIYGPGSIVRLIISGSNKCGHGASLVCCAEGKWAQLGTGQHPSGVRAISLEDQNTANGTAKALIIG
jgi:hypothetical protein